MTSSPHAEQTHSIRCAVQERFAGFCCYSIEHGVTEHFTVRGFPSSSLRLTIVTVCPPWLTHTHTHTHSRDQCMSRRNSYVDVGIRTTWHDLITWHRCLLSSEWDIVGLIAGNSTREISRNFMRGEQCVHSSITVKTPSVVCYHGDPVCQGQQLMIGFFKLLQLVGLQSLIL